MTSKVLLVVSICWIPLAVLSIIHGNFWTGDFTGFITSVEAQTRFLIALPILILADKFVSSRLLKTLMQFLESGLIPKDRIGDFHTIITKKVDFFQNPLTDISLLIIAYLQVVFVFLFETQYTSVASWQFDAIGGELSLNSVGKWAIFVSRPLTIFFIYRWLLRVLVWGRILAKISKLGLKLFPFHADKVGGLGFLSYSISYFVPFSFAFSVILAGNVADLMLVDGMKLVEFRLLLLVYVILLTIFFTYPLFVFAKILIKFREKCVYDLYDGLQSEYNKVDLSVFSQKSKDPTEKLDISYISNLADFNSVVENVLNIKVLPFQVRDLFPLWIALLFPFLLVIPIELPLTDVISKITSLMF